MQYIMISAKNFMKPHVKTVILELLKVIRETENDDLTGTMQRLVCTYVEDVIPIAVEMMSHLVSLSCIYLGPVVQSIVSLTSSLRVISLTVLADSIHNILIFCWKNVSSFCTAKATHIFSAKNFSVFVYHSIKILTNR